MEIDDDDMLVNGIAVKIFCEEVSRIAVGANLMDGGFAGCCHLLNPQELCLQMSNLAYAITFHDAYSGAGVGKAANFALKTKVGTYRLNTNGLSNSGHDGI